MKPTHIIWRCLFHLVSTLGTILLCGYFFVHAQSTLNLNGVSFFSLLVTIFCFLVTYLIIAWFSITIHELGHLVAAWLMHFRVETFVTGPVKLIRIADRFRWQWNTSSFAPGYVHATPVDDGKLLIRQAVFTLGGPAFTLLLAIASLLLCLFLSHHLHTDVLFDGFRSKNTLALHLFFAAGFALLFNCNVLLLSLIPMVLPKGILNDGGILLRLRQHYQQYTRRDLQLASLGFMMTEGVRPNQWNRGELMQCLGAMRSGTVSDLQAYLMGYYHFLDSNSIDVAELLLEKAIECHQAHSTEARPSVLLESVFFKAMFRTDNTNAWDILRQCEENRDIEEPTRLRAQAAAHFVDANYDQAINKAEEALKLLKYSKDEGGALAEADWINAIIARCKSSMPSKIVSEG